MNKKDIIQKLKILAYAAKYDASCASDIGGGLTVRERKSEISRYIYYSWTESGRCMPLLKVLLTNYCIYDCAYCHNRRSNDIERVSLSPEELAMVAYDLYRNNKIEGLFLSSGIIKDPNYTMELALRTIHILRGTYQFRGYIHTKILPGSDLLLIEKIGRLSDRVSINIEFPSEESLRFLAPDKTREKIIRPVMQISELIRRYRNDNKRASSSIRFSPSGQSTQIIVGATKDTDFRTLNLANFLYKRLGLSRVYYSAYFPINEDERLPTPSTPPIKREHRLYQADWLIRDYGFEPEEILNEETQNLSLELDPKTIWALKNIHRFPVELNRADLEDLIRVPGIGRQTAKRIIEARKEHSIDEEGLKRFKIAFNRIRHFITINGKYRGERLDPLYIRKRLLSKGMYRQLQLKLDSEEVRESIIASNTGEF